VREEGREGRKEGRVIRGGLDKCFLSQLCVISNYYSARTPRNV